MSRFQQIVQQELFEPFFAARDYFLSRGRSLEMLDEFAFWVKWGPDSPCVFFPALVHGNETGGIEASFEIAQDLANLPSGNFLFALGHPEAAARGLRFIDRDLNRCFSGQGQAVEYQLAKRLEPLVKKANYVLDLHQTVQPSLSPFLVFHYKDATLNLARKMDGQIPVVTYEGDFSNDGLTLDVFAERSGKTAFVLEMGGIGNRDPLVARKLARSLVETLLGSEDQTLFGSADPNLDKAFTFSQVVQSDPQHDFELRPGFLNFMEVQEGSLVAKCNLSGKEVNAQVSGPVLFPKYGELAKKSSELCLLLKPVDEQTRASWKK